MKTTIFFFAAILMATSGFLSAQNIEYQVTKMMNPVALDTPLDLPAPATRADMELKYINGPIVYGLGRTDYVGTRYASACIEFTAQQLLSFVDGGIHTVRIALSSNTPKIASTGHKVWLKDSKNGTIVYIQDWLNPQAGEWHDVVLIRLIPFRPARGSLSVTQFA
jgi:hypothetical protein